MAAGARVTVVLPRMLAEVLAGGRERVEVEARTVAGAVEAVYEGIPVLRHHLCDESGGFRVHVLVLHNGAQAREAAALRARVKDGDEIRIVQAISGG